MSTIALIALFSGVAFITGWFGRMIQGGQLLAGVTGYRPIAYALYLIPMIISFGFFYPDTKETAMVLASMWFETMNLGEHDILIYLKYLTAAVIIGLIFYPHTGPNHGPTMDMGYVAGTTLSDFLMMMARFTIPTFLAAVLLKAEFVESWVIFILTLIGLIPAITYLICWKIWDHQRQSGTTTFAPTEYAERIYGGLYQGGAVLIMSIGLTYW